MPRSVSSTGAHVCDSCFKSFQRRDLLLRHRRRCLRSNKSAVRRKACNACAQAKTKCCYTQPTCSRCAKRGILCEYVSVAVASSATASSSSLSADLSSLGGRRSPLGDPAADILDSWSSQNFLWALDRVDLPSLPSPSTSVVNQFTLGPVAAIPTTFPLLEETSLAPPDPGIPDLSALTGLGSRDATNSPRASGSSPEGAEGHPANYVRILRKYPRLLLQGDFYSPFLHRTLFNEHVPDMTILPHTSMAICCGSALGTKDGAAYVKRAMDAQRQSLIESYVSTLAAVERSPPAD